MRDLWQNYGSAWRAFNAHLETARIAALQKVRLYLGSRIQTACKQQSFAMSLPYLLTIASRDIYDWHEYVLMLENSISNSKVSSLRFPRPKIRLTSRGSSEFWQCRRIFPASYACQKHFWQNKARPPFGGAFRPLTSHARLTNFRNQLS